jgi:hypothetical protein
MLAQTSWTSVPIVSQNYRRRLTKLAALEHTFKMRRARELAPTSREDRAGIGAILPSRCTTLSRMCWPNCPSLF